MTNLHATRRLAAALLVATATLAGCGATATTPPADGAGTASTATSDGTSSARDTGASTASAAVAGTHADASDYTWDEAEEVAIALLDGGSTAGTGVTVDGDSLTITAGGTYRVTGVLTDGQVVVDSPDEEIVHLVLDGATITSSTTAPISILDAEEVVVVLATGSQNTLTDATTHTVASADVDEPDAALFSTADLTIAGDGALIVNARYRDGIASKDGLVVAGGTITVIAADDGIRGKDYLVVEGGSITVDAGGDALKSTNEEDASLGYVRIAGGALDLEAGSDAIDAWSSAIVDGGTIEISAGDDAIHAETRLEVNGGTVDIARSYEGLEATQIVITGGAITLVAEDDGLNVAGGVDASGWTDEGGFGGQGGQGGGPGFETPIEGYYVEMTGGTLVIDAAGDGFDSNGSATVTGGTIVINGPLGNGNGAIDVNGELLVSDAVLVAAGSIGMAETPSASSAQATLHVQFNNQLAAGTIVRIQAEDGTAIATFEASKGFQSLVVSSPDLVAGAAYEVLTGGTVAGTSLGGLFLDPQYSGGTVIGTVTTTTR